MKFWIVVIVAVLLGYSNVSLAGDKKMAASTSEGQKLAFGRKKGNCLACHQIKGGKLAGTVGPPLLVMKARFPDRVKLRAQIWDASAKNMNSVMPPFGRHGILSEKEIDLITDFIHSL